jgi:hypothetical protein
MRLAAGLGMSRREVDFPVAGTPQRYHPPGVPAARTTALSPGAVKIQTTGSQIARPGAGAVAARSWFRLASG